MTLGSGKFTYELVHDWAKVPEGWKLDISDIAVDSRGRVYAFNRSIHPMVIFDKDGNFITSWGEGQFRQPHGICIGPDGMLYLTDIHMHQVMKYTKEGKLLKTWGTKDAPGITFLKTPFNMPTDVAFSPSGEMYVSDGYGNRCVHKYDKAGEHILTWGDGGSGPGQFAVVHMLAVDSRGLVYVVDRDNNRVQIFDPQGKFLAEWPNLRRPVDIHIDKDDTVFLAERGGKRMRGLPCRMNVYTRDGKLLSQWEGDREGGDDTIEQSPHGMGVDAQGSIYLTDDGPFCLKKYARKG